MSPDQEQSSRTVDAIISLPGLHQPLSSMSHLTGAVVFTWLSYYLLRPLFGDWGRFASVAIFTLAAIGLLAISSIYHMFAHDEYAGSILLRVDLAAIFVLIAGSFTPVHAILFAGWKRWGILALIWSIAIVGILVRMIFFETITRPFGAVIFLAMGWIGGYTSYLFYRRGDWHYLGLAVAGGIFYSLGAVSNAAGWPTLIPGIWGPHETMHFAVLGG
ncbi:MAG: PAQR family membrane homeostasis protein TrhA, partial [Pirellulaceae bacterium]